MCLVLNSLGNTPSLSRCLPLTPPFTVFNPLSETAVATASGKRGAEHHCWFLSANAPRKRFVVGFCSPKLSKIKTNLSYELAFPGNLQTGKNDSHLGTSLLGNLPSVSAGQIVFIAFGMVRVVVLKAAMWPVEARVTRVVTGSCEQLVLL
jgi:hypothetical protein